MNSRLNTKWQFFVGCLKLKTQNASTLEYNVQYTAKHPHIISKERGKKSNNSESVMAWICSVYHASLRKCSLLRFRFSSVCIIPERLVSCQNSGQLRNPPRTWVSVREVQDVNEWYISAGWLTYMELGPQSYFEVCSGLHMSSAFIISRGLRL